MENNHEFQWQVFMFYILTVLKLWFNSQTCRRMSIPYILQIQSLHLSFFLPTQRRPHPQSARQESRQPARSLGRKRLHSASRPSTQWPRRRRGRRRGRRRRRRGRRKCPAHALGLQWFGFGTWWRRARWWWRDKEGEVVHGRVFESVQGA